MLYVFCYKYLTWFLFSWSASDHPHWWSPGMQDPWDPQNIVITCVLVRVRCKFQVSSNCFATEALHPSDPFSKMCVCGLLIQSCLTLLTLWTRAHQAPLSMGFPRQEYWSGLPFSSSRDRPSPGPSISCIGRWILSHQGSPHYAEPVFYSIVFEHKFY